MIHDILIWDSEDLPPIHNGTTVLWRRRISIEHIPQVSIPSLVEENADIFKMQYLNWIYELGQLKVNGSNVKELLKIRENLSYWWLTPLAQKSNFSKSPQINDAIHLLAFFFWASNRPMKKIKLFSRNTDLKMFFNDWCNTKDIEFEFTKIPKMVNKKSIRHRLFNLLPSSIQALSVFAMYVVTRWNLRHVGFAEWRNSNAKLTFVSYLFGQTSGEYEKIDYTSPFWGDLPDELKKAGKKTNWLHIYIKDLNFPNSASASNYIRELNLANNDQVHATLDSFLSIKIIFKTLKDWILIRVAMKKVMSFLGTKSLNNLNIWPLFLKEWRGNARGMDLIQNVLQMNLIEAAFVNMQKQSIGTYLFEQQPWELALISAWKRLGHEKLVGFQHSTMSYWDLRYFQDIKSNIIEGDLELPQPDLFAINSLLAMKLCRDWNYPQSKLREVEALRYSYLISLAEGRISRAKQENSFKLLVLGDYLQVNTDRQMRILEDALPLFPRGIEVVIKPHPNCPIRLNEYKLGKSVIKMSPIVELLLESSVAFTSVSTSAALEAYCLGLPLISMINLGELNLSPLRGVEEVAFVSTGSELASKVISLIESQVSDSINKDIFFLDSKLTRWKRILF